MDTMSLHMAISGLTGFQRTLWMANKLGKKRGLQEVKEHIKKAGQKREGSMVCVHNSFILQLRRALLMEMFAQSVKIFLLSWLLGFCHHQISMWHDVSVCRLAPGTGWISAALTTWLMSMLYMWEGRHCRRRPERPLWRGTWWMSGTTSRSETFHMYQIRLSVTKCIQITRSSWLTYLHSSWSTDK